MNDETKNLLDTALRQGRISSAEHTNSYLLGELVDELRQLNRYMAQLLNGPKPPEPIVKIVKRAQAEK